MLWQNASDSFHHRVNFIPHSLLDDVPVKTDINQTMPEPLVVLTTMLKAIYVFTKDDMKSFLKAVECLWQEIDGEKNVRGLAEKVKICCALSEEKSLAFTALIIAYFGKKGLIVSKDRDR